MNPDDIFKNVLLALQPAEELNGPTGADYIALMGRIAAEAQRRIDSYLATYQVSQ